MCVYVIEADVMRHRDSIIRGVYRDYFIAAYKVAFKSTRVQADNSDVELAIMLL